MDKTELEQLQHECDQLYAEWIVAVAQSRLDLQACEDARVALQQAGIRADQSKLHAEDLAQQIRCVQTQVTELRISQELARRQGEQQEM